MSETFDESKEYNNKPVWQELVDIEKLIEQAVKEIDASGSDFMAKNAIIQQLRKQYGWYDKWQSLADTDISKWANAYERYYNFNIAGFGKKAPLQPAGYFLDLAKKYILEASQGQLPNNSDVAKGLVKVEVDTLRSDVKELEGIKANLLNQDLKKVARDLIKWIISFQKEVVYKNMDVNSRSYFEEYLEAIEANIDDKDFLYKMLPKYINTLIDEIIHYKK